MPNTDPNILRISKKSSCQVKSLPEDQVVAAAATATRINPRNAPSNTLLSLSGSQGLGTSTAALSVVTAKYWGGCGVRLTVSFLDNAPTDLQKRILTHMNAWGAYCNVQFTLTNGTGQVRIARVAGGDDGGYWSYLGTDILHVGSGKPTMNLDSFTMDTAESEFHRVVRHETGHTLGFPHEHLRKEIVADIDPDKAIAYFLANDNWNKATTVSNVLTPLDASALVATAAPDPNSIMCYWLPAEIMKDGVAVAGGTDIDATDAQFAAGVYPLPPFLPVFAQGDPGLGVGGFDLKNSADQAFAFDYNGSGKLDHVVLYRPGTGAVFIVRNNAGNFTAVYAQGAPGHGIGGFDLKSSADRAFAFDYDSSGKLDHLVFYRPGTGAIFILKNTGGNFTAVYVQGAPGHGIGGFDLLSPADRGFAFDYDGSGKLDHLVFYRPGTGAVFILKHSGGNFTAVYAQGAPGHGIGGYDLLNAADQAFAFDYDHSGKLDHMVLYRPGTGAIFILKNTGGTFTAVYAQGAPGHGIGGYDLKNAADRAFAYDYDRSGKLDALALYRPGTGTMWILKNSGGSFSPVYHQGDPGCGIGGYDLKNGADRAFALDYDHIGKADHMALYRPGTGTFWVLARR